MPEAEAGRRRRRWTMADKIRVVEQTYEPGASISRVARRNAVAYHLLRRWRRLASRGALDKAATERRCAHCNEPFEAARADAKFCSSKCRQRAYRRHKRARLRRARDEFGLGPGSLEAPG